MSGAPIFRIGETVVEPSIGICRVQGIREMQIDGISEEYYIFQSPNQTRVLVPRSQLKKRGVHKPMSRDEIKKVTSSLRIPVNPIRGNAREQYLDYQATMKSGDPSKITKLLRSLFILEQADDLKGKEKELMEQARKFLIEEITFIKGTPKAQIASDINDSLKQMYKKKVAKDREEAKTARAAARKEK